MRGVTLGAEYQGW